MTLQRKFQGVWIPADVWLDRSLSITEKVMLVEISSLQDDVRGCYASNAHFGEFFDLSNSRVSEIISSLAAKGFVEVELMREGKRIVERRIRLVNVFEKPNTPSEKATNPFGKGDEPPSEKAKGSNTNNNNTKSNNLKTESVEEAFEVFWKSTSKQGSKKKAGAVFASICKRDKLEPMAFAATLVTDVLARVKAQQFGFDRLHITTYLNQERWTDEAPKASAGDSKSAGFAKDFSQTTYTGTPDDQFADFLK